MAAQYLYARLAWELNPNTRPNRIVWNAVWELPFGKGRQWLTKGPMQHVVGGWQLSWIYQYQTGAPISWSNLFYYGTVGQVVQALAEGATHAANSRQEYSTAAVYSPIFNSSDSATAPISSGWSDSRPLRLTAGLWHQVLANSRNTLTHCALTRSANGT